MKTQTLLICCISMAMMVRVMADLTFVGTSNLQRMDACDNQHTCGSGLKCISNVCLSEAESMAWVETQGNRCNTNECCQNGLVCLEMALICVPSADVGGMKLVACTGAPPVPDENIGDIGEDELSGGLPSGINIPDQTGGLQSCDNLLVCPTGKICLANVCLDQSTVDPSIQISGVGNLCSATNCCPANLGCVTAINRCSVRPPQTSQVTGIFTECNGVPPPPGVGALDQNGNPINTGSQSFGAADAVATNSRILLVGLAGLCIFALFQI